METAIKNIDLAAMATEVQAVFTTALETLTGFEEMIDAMAAANKASLPEGYRGPWSELKIEDFRQVKTYEAETSLVSSLSRALGQINANLKNELKSIARSAERRAEQLDSLDAELTYEIERRAVAANKLAAETAEIIETDFYLISGSTSSTGKGKNKKFSAEIVFLLKGEVFDLDVNFDGETREIAKWDRRDLGHSFTNRKTEARANIFKAEMSAEEIGKAAHVIASIEAAFNELLKPAAAAEAAAA
ncbi:hypothetical protein ACC684_28575 [Rhizobium ruizarguesonis]